MAPNNQFIISGKTQCQWCYSVRPLHTAIAVDKVAQAVIQFGRGAKLAKTDVKAAYWLMPVHLQDKIELGFKCNDLLYVEGCLPFGLRSAPKLFNTLADALA